MKDPNVKAKAAKLLDDLGALGRQALKNSALLILAGITMGILALIAAVTDRSINETIRDLGDMTPEQKEKLKEAVNEIKEESKIVEEELSKPKQSIIQEQPIDFFDDLANSLNIDKTTLLIILTGIVILIFVAISRIGT